MAEENQKDASIAQPENGLLKATKLLLRKLSLPRGLRTRRPASRTRNHIYQGYWIKYH
jgi:hypothetical protein